MATEEAREGEPIDTAEAKLITTHIRAIFKKVTYQVISENTPKIGRIGLMGPPGCPAKATE